MRCPKVWWLLPLLCFLWMSQARVIADEYAFDVEAFQPKKLDIHYRLHLRPAVGLLQTHSRLYRLTLADRNTSRQQWPVTMMADTHGTIKTGQRAQVLFDALWSVNHAYSNTHNTQTINELVYRFDHDARLQTGIGKKAFKWGKAYAWNPVNFFGRQKDLNDTDLALPGYNLLYSQFSRSSSGYLSNSTLTMALLPVAKGLNGGFTDAPSLNFAAQFYMLLGDTDIDLLWMIGTAGNHKFGIDYSRNLKSNHELHAEMACESQGKQACVTPGGAVRQYARHSTSFVVGTRYLDRREITYILEYLHNGNGFNQEDFQRHYDAADLALATNDQPGRQTAVATVNQYLNRQFAGQDYLYGKASKPELFGHLYLNGSVFTLVNLADKSTSTTCEVNFTGAADRIITLRLTANRGNNNSEYRQKLNAGKIELRWQHYF